MLPVKSTLLVLVATGLLGLVACAPGEGGGAGGSGGGQVGGAAGAAGVAGAGGGGAAGTGGGSGAGGAGGAAAKSPARAAAGPVAAAAEPVGRRPVAAARAVRPARAVVGALAVRAVPAARARQVVVVAAVAREQPAVAALAAPASGGSCMMGNLTYTLQRAANPTTAEQAAYDGITAAMNTALMHYNCYTNITKVLSVSYVPSVATADGNTNGSIRFGSMASMNFVTAMHETSHTLGVGAPAFDALIVNGVFTGAAATAQLREITGDPAEEVHGDSQHFWPYGLNYESEYMSIADAINHCKMVVAIRRDIGF